MQFSQTTAQLPVVSSTMQKENLHSDLSTYSILFDVRQCILRTKYIIRTTPPSFLLSSNQIIPYNSSLFFLISSCKLWLFDLLISKRVCILEYCRRELHFTFKLDVHWKIPQTIWIKMFHLTVFFSWLALAL